MKKVLCAMVVLTVLVTSLVCVGQVLAAEKTKTLNMALFWMAKTLDPAVKWDGWTLAGCGIGENLVQADEDLNFKPVVAESWKTLDETTTVFTIRENLKFQNGTPVDAAAVKASLERTLRLTNRNDVKFPVKSIEADGRQLTIKTDKPFASLINLLADPVYAIIDVKAAETQDIKTKPVATGPFTVVKFEPGISLILEKNPYHWSGDVGVDVVNIKCIPDASTRSLALQSGEIDFAGQIPSQDLGLFEGKDEFNVLRGANLRIMFLRTNMAKPYMKHLDFRQAVSHGIDKVTYATKLVDGIPAKGPFNQTLPFAYTGDDYYTYDPEKARNLLDTLGYKDGDGDGIREADGKNIVLKLVFSTSNQKEGKIIGVAMQSQLKEIGLGMTLQQLENTDNVQKSGDFDFILQKWTSAPTADPQYFLEGCYQTGAISNDGNYSNAEFDAVCKILRDTYDRKQRNALGRKATEILLKDAASIFLFYGKGSIVTSSKVAGVHRFISEVYYIDERVKIKE